VPARNRISISRLRSGVRRSGGRPDPGGETFRHPARTGNRAASVPCDQVAEFGKAAVAIEAIAEESQHAPTLLRQPASDDEVGAARCADLESGSIEVTRRLERIGVADQDRVVDQGPVPGDDPRDQSVTDPFLPGRRPDREERRPKAGGRRTGTGLYR
jgi:hypothetical protein